MKKTLLLIIAFLSLALGFTFVAPASVEAQCACRPYGCLADESIEDLCENGPYCCKKLNLPTAPPPTNTPKPPGGGGELSPTSYAGSSGEYCGDKSNPSQYCFDTYCAGDSSCSSVCSGGYCFTSDDDPPTGVPSQNCNTYGNWGSCGGDAGTCGGCASTGYKCQTRFCIDPITSNKYQISCCTGGGGPGGGGATSTPRPTDQETDAPIPTSTTAPTNTPTPTPTTPPAPGPWTKLKGTSYYSKSSLTDNIPLAPALYDSDDTLDAHFILQGDSGGLTAGSTISLTGLNGSAKPNENDWLLTGYTSSFSMTPTVFKGYVAARKEFKSITSLDDIDADGIYIWAGSDPLVIDDTNKSNFNNRKAVLITTGTVTVSATTLSPTSGALAVVASTIIFSGTTVQVDAWFVQQFNCWTNQEYVVCPSVVLTDIQKAG